MEAAGGDVELGVESSLEHGWVAASRAAPSRERCAGGDVSTLTAAAAPIDGQVLEGRAEPRPAEARAR